MKCFYDTFQQQIVSLAKEPIDGLSNALCHLRICGNGVRYVLCEIDDVFDYGVIEVLLRPLSITEVFEVVRATKRETILVHQLYGKIYYYNRTGEPQKFMVGDRVHVNIFVFWYEDTYYVKFNVRKDSPSA